MYDHKNDVEFMSRLVSYQRRRQQKATEGLASIIMVLIVGLIWLGVSAIIAAALMLIFHSFGSVDFNFWQWLLIVVAASLLWQRIGAAFKRK